jgi:hypothetical protein
MTHNGGIHVDDALALPDQPIADSLGLYREPSALLIREAESLPNQLLPQGSISLLEISDHVLLVPIDPASEDQHQKLQALPLA